MSIEGMGICRDGDEEDWILGGSWPPLTTWSMNGPKRPLEPPKGYVHIDAPGWLDEMRPDWSRSNCGWIKWT